MDLSGTWLAAPADEELRRSFHLSDFDASGWEPVSVPGHWQENAAFADHDDAVLMHHRFSADRPDDERTRSWLEFDGIFYQGDVYLDGDYLGDTEGYFVRHSFDITSHRRDRTDHTLAVEVNCRPAGGGKRRSIMGVYEGGNDVVHSGNPGGIWAPVRTRDTGPVAITDMRAVCVDADTTQARIAVRATLDTNAVRTVTVRTTIAGVDHAEEHRLADGSNEIEWYVNVPEPDLWWPHQLGEQPMHDLAVTVETRRDETSDERQLSIGLRRLRSRNWKFEINGERLFLKGANLAPTNIRPAHADPTAIGEHLDLAIAAGLDLVRPYANVEPQAFYEQADIRGLLVWQDLPLLGPASNSLRGQAVRQAHAMVNQLGHHPSIVRWNAHVAPAPEWMEAAPPSPRRGLERFVGHQMPTWTKSVLDRSIKRVFEHEDGSRPCSAFTGVLPHLPRLDGSASHLWFGWRRGSERDLGDFATKVPSQVRFVAEFGAQSVPATGAVADTVAWPDPDTAELEASWGYEKASFDRYAPPVGHETAAGWIDATQQYQSGLLRRQIEALRRLKYRPTGGFCVHFLRDTQPRVSSSLVGEDNAAKLGYGAVMQACQPVIVVADRLPARLTPGDTIALDVHVISDLRHPLVDAEVEAELIWQGGSHRWRFGGTIAADDVTRVGTLSWVVPVTPGLATLTLALAGPRIASNRYDATIGKPV